MERRLSWIFVSVILIKISLTAPLLAEKMGKGTNLKAGEPVKQKCPKGQFYFDDYYQSGCKDCPTKCATCTSREACQSCVDEKGITWNSGQEKCERSSCPKGKYLGENRFYSKDFGDGLEKECLDCSYRCLECTSKDYCTSCKDGYKTTSSGRCTLDNSSSNGPIVFLIVIIVVIFLFCCCLFLITNEIDKINNREEYDRAPTQRAPKRRENHVSLLSTTSRADDKDILQSKKEWEFIVEKPKPEPKPKNPELERPQNFYQNETRARPSQFSSMPLLMPRKPEKPVLGV